MPLCSPKPVLKAYQDRKRPDFIYKQNQLLSTTSGIIKPPGSIEESSTKSPVQSLQHEDALKEKQV